MSRVLHVSDSPGELRLAVAEAGRVVAVEIHRAGQPDRVGEVHLARVIAQATGAAGWFVQLTDTEAFLPMGEVPRGERHLHDGQSIVVRIVRASIGGKGLRASMKRAPRVPAGRAAVALLQAAPAPIGRLAAEWDAASVREAEQFPPELEEQLALLLEPDAPLPRGGRLRLHPTPAATLIDIDAAGVRADEVNRAAVSELARQVIARNLSGVILVDFAALDSPSDRKRTTETLRASLEYDPLAAEVTGHSPSGLVEIVRRKVRPPLHELCCVAEPPFRLSALSYGLSALRRAMAEAMARPALRPALLAHPAVVAALEQDPAALASFARRAGSPIVLIADAGTEPGAERVEDARGR
jgi:Ribonuclease G/E